MKESGRSALRLLGAVNARIARFCLVAGIAGLFALVAVVVVQVFGRYVLNDTPVWAESLALVLILYVTLLGAAAGVRDSGHIGLESLLLIARGRVRLAMEMIVVVLVGAFGVLMVVYGGTLGLSVARYLIPTLGISEGINHLPVVIAGALIVLFSIEHALALLLGEKVEPAWH
jgi:TRAP-type C4-dicarboxylate transport system permease small subunit